MIVEKVFVANGRYFRPGEPVLPGSLTEEQLREAQERGLIATRSKTSQKSKTKASSNSKITSTNTEEQ